MPSSPIHCGLTLLLLFDFVLFVNEMSLSKMCLFIDGLTITFDSNFPRNQNCGAGWEDYQAIDCELKLGFVHTYIFLFAFTIKVLIMSLFGYLKNFKT